MKRDETHARETHTLALPNSLTHRPLRLREMTRFFGYRDHGEKRALADGTPHVLTRAPATPAVEQREKEILYLRPTGPTQLDHRHD